MAMIPCIECGRQISDRADACPECGCPVFSQDQASVVTRQTVSPQVQVIEATAKKWKGLQLAGALLLCLSIVIVIIGAAGKSGGIQGIGGTVFFLGFGMYAFGRFSAWWHHK